MGTDIHWIMERRHEDGGWETVATEEYNSLRDLPRHHYLVEIGKRNYELFGILSAIRFETPDQAAKLATPGLPKDVSPFAQAAFSPLSARGPLHDRGWFTLGELRRAAEADPDGVAPHPEDRAVLIEWHACVESALLEPDPISMDEILPLPHREESNHARLARAGRATGLMPIDDDTFRLVIAYDT